MALAPQQTPVTAGATGSTSASPTVRTVAGGQTSGEHVDTSAKAAPHGGAGSGTAPGNTAPPRGGHIVDDGQRKLTFLLALPAIVLLLPLFVLPFFGRRRYY